MLSAIYPEFVPVNLELKSSLHPRLSLTPIPRADRSVYFAGGRPAAYCLGESIAKGCMFAIHFEKAIDEYKGIYQFMNQAFAAGLPRFFVHINREQDLGSEGLRQAKMTYRPAGFVRKFRGVKHRQF
jgi:hypothetical protein